GGGRLERGDRLDAAMVAAVNRHQLRDKGFGPALGPKAAETAIARFRALGYQVVHDKSDWVFAPHDREIQREVCSGWAIAARELAALSVDDIAGWLTRRHALIERGARMRVGHVDFFAQPIATR